MTAVRSTGRGRVIIIDVADVAAAVAASSGVCSSSAEAPPLLLASSLLLDAVVDQAEECEEAHDRADELVDA